MTMTPHSSPQTRRRAFGRYMGGERLRQISEDMGIRLSVLKGWHYREKWARKRRDIEGQIYQDWRNDYVGDSVTISRQIFLRYAGVVNEILSRMESGLEEEKLTPGQLLALSRSLKATWPIVERAFAAVADSPVNAAGRPGAINVPAIGTPVGAYESEEEPDPF